MYSQRYDAALTLAARAHQGQTRKGTDVPYIVHVVNVSLILQRYGFDEDITIAGLLHDVIEDCGTSRETVANAFGERVAGIVATLTKPGDGLSWEENRAAIISQLEQGGPDAATVKAADTLHNVRSLWRDIQASGPAVWQRFQRGAAPNLAYYRRVVTSVQHVLGNHPLCHELAQAMDELEALHPAA
jgi:(p)ppGpp synthase/HD superfamily hydrolase